MNLEDLKDQLKESFENAKQQIEDSSLYIQLKEKYDVLDPRAQKAMTIGGIVLAIVLVMMLPLSFLSTSTEQSASFEEKRALIKDLMKTDRQLKSGPQAPKPLTPSQLRRDIERIVSSSRLLPEQVLSTNSTSPRIGLMVSSAINTNAVVVSLGKLNLQQIVDIGLRLSNIHQSVKMSNLEVSADAEDDHYFNVKYEMTVFDIAKVSPPAAKEDEKPKRGNNRRQRRPRRGGS